MAHDPVKVAETQLWLVKGLRDLTAAKQLLAQTPPMLDVVVYHCQQTVEKVLKGFLYWHDTEFRKTHNLVELLALCAQHDDTLDELAVTAQLLTPYAHEFRSPGELLEPPRDEAADALSRAQAAAHAIMQRLPDVVLPPEAQT